MKRVIRRSSKNFLLDLSYIYLIICQATTDGDERTPSFAEPIPNVTVAVGRDASLPCIINNIGKYKVMWIHIDSKMMITIHKRVVSRIPRFTISVKDDKTWVLHVAKVQLEDRGYYMCQVNTNPIMSQVGYLQVMVPPDFVEDGTTSPKNIVVRENQNLTLTCKAQGFPAPRIVWKREDDADIVLNKDTKGAMFFDESIHFERISRTDMANYICIASNGAPPAVIKKISVAVEFSPIVIVTNQLIASSLGSSVVLECQTEANPLASTCWVLNETKLVQNWKYNIRKTSNSYHTYSKLIINNLTKSDFGNYRCISKNTFGEAESTVRLYEYAMAIAKVTLPAEPKTTDSVWTVYYKGATDAPSDNTIHDDKIEKNHLFKNNLKLNVSSNLHRPPSNTDEFLFYKKTTNSADYIRWSKWSIETLLFGYVHIIMKFL